MGKKWHSFLDNKPNQKYEDDIIINPYFYHREVKFSKLLFAISLLKHLFIFGVFVFPLIYYIFIKSGVFTSIYFDIFGTKLNAGNTAFTLLLLTFLFMFIYKVYEESHIRVR